MVRFGASLRLKILLRVSLHVLKKKLVFSKKNFTPKGGLVIPRLSTSFRAAFLGGLWEATLEWARARLSYFHQWNDKSVIILSKLVYIGVW